MRVCVRVRVCVCVHLQIYTMMWAARLGVPMVFASLKLAVSNVVGANRWGRLKRKLDWYPHHLALQRFKGDQVRFECEFIVTNLLLILF